MSASARFLIGLLLVCLLGATAVAEEGRQPLGPPRPLLQVPLQPPVLPQRPVNVRQGSHLLLETGRPLREFDLDRGLTALCRDGRFRQKRDRFLVVRLGGFVHGAVVGGHWSLYDPEGFAVPELVYAVKGQDTARCEVYVIRHITAGE